MTNAQMIQYAPANRDMRSDYERSLEAAINKRLRFVRKRLRDAGEVQKLAPIYGWQSRGSGADWPSW